MTELFNRRWIRTFDWITLALIILITSISLLFVFSTTYRPACPYSIFFKKQLFGFCSGYLIYLIASSIDYRRLQHWAILLYVMTVLLLVFTLFKGSVGLGAPRWINLGIIKFQPSELPKLLYPAFFSAVLLHEGRTSWRLFTLLISITIISCLLIAKQPDLGTAIIIGLSALMLLAGAGVGKRFFITLILAGSIAMPGIWHLLKPYQKQRVLVFLGYGSVHKERYQIEQSFIAIGSGGIFGKGTFQGTQNMLQFLPESRTDFIFAIVCEEWGFLGALLIITLYLLLFFRWLLIIPLIQDPYAQLLGLGMIAPIIIATIVNICMVTGLCPVTGIPLPLMSYGITHSWITLASIGILNSIILHRGT